MKNENFFKKNSKYIVISVHVIAIILISSFLNKFLIDFKPFEILSKAIVILKPFIYGFVIAYIINPAMNYIECSILGRISFLNNHSRLKRFSSIIITYVIAIGFIFCISWFIIPEMVKNIKNIFLFMNNIDRLYIENFLNENVFKSENYQYISRDLSYIIMKFIDKNVSVMAETFMFTNSSSAPIFNKIIMSTMGLASKIINLVLGFVIAFYMLNDKEKFTLKVVKTIYVFLGEDLTNKIVKIVKKSNNIFERFFLGKIIDSVIVGVIFFIGVSVFDVPYAILLSVIVGITNVIPYFGPFIGGIPVVLITMFTDPVMALWLAVFLFLLQQFDGIILGPKILGDSIGVKPISVIFAITVGGALFGVAGMFFGLPVFAVITAAYNTFIEERYKKAHEETHKKEEDKIEQSTELK